jgi:hypothetical protein
VNQTEIDIINGRVCPDCERPWVECVCVLTFRQLVRMGHVFKCACRMEHGRAGCSCAGQAARASQPEGRK